MVMHVTGDGVVVVLVYDFMILSLGEELVSGLLMCSATFGMGLANG